VPAQNLVFRIEQRNLRM